MRQNKIIGKCNLCGTVKKLCKAHIIPKSFYYGLRKNNEIPYLYSVGLSIHPKRIRVGIYDNNILCLECDHTIGKFDCYAAELLLQPSYNIIDYKDEKFIKIDTFNYIQLKIFLLSVVWRASITSIDIFSSIYLGEYESIIKAIIAESKLLYDEYFSCILIKYDSELANNIPNPEMRNFNGINYCRLRMAQYLFIIKIDKRPFDVEFIKYIMKPEKPLMIVYKSFKNSSDYKNLIKNGVDYL